ncbi:MAG: hypothetical protein R3270_07595 [Gammaproteobacteria bacterium]|nr:hypothetical protein [Gammaproteobacteria bacterium]
MELFVAFILLVFTVVAVTLILRARRQPEGFRVQETPIPLQQVWDEWLQGENLDDAERARRQAIWTEVPAETRQDVLDDLLRFEERALESPRPLITIRKEIMDSVDRRLLNQEILALPPELKQQLRDSSSEALQNDHDAWLYISANELRLEILRELAARRFGDAAENGWFTVYEKAGRLKQRSLRHFLRRSIAGELHEAEDSRQQAITMVDGALRARLLDVAPGTEFKGLDERESR